MRVSRFEDDSLLVVPMRAAAPEVLTPSLVHSLSHAWFSSSHIWLDEGTAQFLSLLWIEQSQGREVAVKQLAAGSEHAGVWQSPRRLPALWRLLLRVGLWGKA